MRRLLVWIICLATVTTIILQMMSERVDARPWRATPESLAQDYLVIVDQRTPTELVMVFWLSPIGIPATPQTKLGRETLSKYLLIGVGHVEITSRGQVSSRNASPPVLVTDASGEKNHIHDDQLDPIAQGAVKTLQAVFQQGLGPMGRNIVWYMFDSNEIQSCGIGGFAIKFANEAYTYKTPIPGCP